MNMITRSLTFCFCSLLCLCFSQAQEPEQSPISESAKALQFHINDNFTLSSFQGGAISYKHHLSPSFALRIGLGALGQDGDSESASDNIQGSTVTNSTENLRDRTNINLQLNVQAIWYSPTASEIFFFYGIGPLFGYSGSWQTEKTTYVSSTAPSTSTYTTKSKSFSWSVGFSGVAGVEWFPAQSISIHAEYGTNLTYSWTSTESESHPGGTGSRSENEGTSTSLQMAGAGVNLGLSVYF